MSPITSLMQADNTQTSVLPPTQTQSAAKDQQNQFLQLLVAQIKGQNPLDPMQGTEFVSQLAQFSSLEELTKIRGTMESVQQILSTVPATANPFSTNTEN